MAGITVSATGLTATDPSTNSNNSSSVSPTGSPYTYTAINPGFLIVNAGTVTLIEFARNGTFITVGVLAGIFPVGINDQLRITYAVAPTLTFIPR